MEDLTPKQKEIIATGLSLYKEKLKKMLKQSQTLKVGEKEVKQTFLEADKLYAEFSAS